jgi:hypothetical protein
MINKKYIGNTLALIGVGAVIFIGLETASDPKFHCNQLRHKLAELIYEQKQDLNYLNQNPKLREYKYGDYERKSIDEKLQLYKQLYDLYKKDCRCK